MINKNKPKMILAANTVLPDSFHLSVPPPCMAARDKSSGVTSSPQATVIIGKIYSTVNNNSFFYFKISYFLLSLSVFFFF